MSLENRAPRPKETSEETDEMFNIIETVDHRFEMIRTGSYSEEMVDSYRKEIEELKSMFSQGL